MSNGYCFSSSDSIRFDSIYSNDSFAAQVGIRNCSIKYQRKLGFSYKFDGVAALPSFLSLSSQFHFFVSLKLSGSINIGLACFMVFSLLHHIACLFVSIPLWFVKLAYRLDYDLRNSFASESKFTYQKYETE